MKHEIAHQNIAKIVKHSIKGVASEVYPHQVCSSGLAPSDYHLLRSLSNYLNGLSFNKIVEIKTWLYEGFVFNDLYRRDIEQSMAR